jgi:hypothetical protein
MSQALGKTDALSVEEAHRINRVQLALLLHKTPAEIDAIPLQDIADIVEVQRGERMVQELKQKQAAAMAKTRRARR